MMRRNQRPRLPSSCPTLNMSLSCSDRFTDLLCAEDSDEVLSGESPACSSELESPTTSIEESSIDGFIEDETNFVPGFDYLARFQCQSLDASAREESVAWILKVQAYYNLQPLTAYLSVNYLDRFLYSRRLPLDPTATFLGFLISRASNIILSNIKEASFLEYRPSSIAAAAILCAANEIPNLSLFNPEHAESWCDGLSKEKILSCYRLMQELVEDNARRKQPKVLPQLRVAIRGRMRPSDSSSSSSSLPSYKRRKLNHCFRVDDDRNSK
ncbi:hypothetical protein V6N13_107986 [Hibiscus sabdariffa]